MTLPGKTQNNSHGCYSPERGASVRTRAPVEGAHHDNFAAFEKRNYGLTFVCGRSSRGADVTLFHSGTRAGSARHCAAGMPARSRSLLRGVGVCSWGTNQRHDGRFRQIAARTNLSAKISGLGIGEFPSAISQGSQHLARQNTISPSAPARIRDRRADGCAATARRPLPSTPSWPTSSLASNDFQCGSSPAGSVHETVSEVEAVLTWQRSVVSTDMLKPAEAQAGVRVDVHGLLLRHVCHGELHCGLRVQARGLRRAATRRLAYEPGRYGRLQRQAGEGPVSISAQSVRESNLNNRMVSRHRFDGIATPVIRRRKVQVGVRLACSLVSGFRRACSQLHADALPSPSAHTSERIEPSDRCHASAWHHHLLSDRSGALSPPCTGARHAGVVRDRGFRKRADGGSPATTARIQAVGYSVEGGERGRSFARTAGIILRRAA